MASVLRRVYASTRKAQLVIKDLARFREIAVVLARYGFGALVERTSEILPLGPLLRPSPQLMQQTLPQRVVGVLADLGPTFVKFGQIMSTRADVLPPEFLAELVTLQDRVPPVPFAEVREVIRTALGKPPEELFKHIDEKPLASASIAQVHTAVTLEGEEVVLKVQRPAVKEKVASDLSILMFLARQAEEIAPETQLLNLVGMVEEFERSMARETDFTVEASNIERFTRNFAHRDDVKIPRLYRPLSTDTVLTMERIRGRKLTVVKEAKDGTPVDMDRVVAVYLSAAYQMLFRDGFFHGDLHPGNALLMDDGRLALLDFGMVGRMSREMRDKLIDVVFALQSEDLPAVARTFYRLGIPNREVDFQVFESDVVDVMELHFVGRSIQDIRIGQFFRDLVEVAMRHSIRMPPDYTMLFKALVTTEGLAKTIAPAINPVEEARPYIESAIRDRYDPMRLKNQVMSDLMDLGRMVRSLPAITEHVLQDLERGQLQVRVDASNRLVDAANRLARSRDRMTGGILAAACILSFGLLGGEARGSVSLTAAALVLGGLGVAGLLLMGMLLWRGK